MSAPRYWVRVDHLLSEMVPGHEPLVPVVIRADYLAVEQEKQEMARCVVMLCEATGKTDYACYAAAQAVLAQEDERDV